MQKIRGFQLALATLSFVAVSCSNNKFKLTSPEIREDILAQKTVFDKSVLAKSSFSSLAAAEPPVVSPPPSAAPPASPVNNDCDGSVCVPPTPPAPPAPPASPPAPPSPPAAPPAAVTPGIPAGLLCSTDKTEDNQGNLKSATAPITVSIRDAKGKNVLCEETSNTFKDIILNEKRIPMPSSCSNLGPNATIQVAVYEKPNQNFVYSEGSPYNLSSDRKLYVLINSYKGEKVVDPACEEKSSPLFVELGAQESLILSDPKSGIMFDILGSNAFPSPHTKKKISWFQNKKYMFLVNPTVSEKVTGVDQMFGDNTLGPDNKFSRDGFEALAKYDQNGDSVIDSEDAIFSKLRLWHDSNADGIAEPGELFYLDFLGVKAIELVYDRGYFEEDIYGNEIRYKSLVQMKDGSLNLMFDLWFQYLKEE